MKRVILVYFSPTSGTRNLLRKVAEGTGIQDVEEWDLSLEAGRRRKDWKLDEQALVVFGAPVYRRRIPAQAMECFQRIRGAHQPTACVVVYGNVAVGDALLELVQGAEGCDLEVMAAASFVSEHSFSEADCPIAEGRPDGKDLNSALAFGERFAEKARRGQGQLPEIPGSQPFNEPPSMPPMGPGKTPDCMLCLHCRTLCPVGAIDDRAESDKERCIMCCACVKGCPMQARSLSNPMLDPLKKKLAICPRKETQIYL